MRRKTFRNENILEFPLLITSRLAAAMIAYRMVCDTMGVMETWETWE